MTPAPVAAALCAWAIQRPDQTVLDLGVGEGAFALAAVQRLVELGADTRDAAARVYGAELDHDAHGSAQQAALSQLGVTLPNVLRGDFHSLPLPSVHAVVGNPPYIRRHYQRALDRAIAANGLAEDGQVSGLTDAYCFFLLRALQALEPGGRAAVIVSASWLDMNYGRQLKRYLLDEFRIHALISFDGRVFSDALVKPVVLLASRAGEPASVAFSRLKLTVPLEHLQTAIEDISAGRDSILLNSTTVPQSRLSADAPWSAYLRAPLLYDELARRAGLVPLAEVARSRIGLQTFAKPFFLLTREDAAKLGIEPEYLLPIIPSPKASRVPVISDAGTTTHVLFACDRPLDRLTGTNAGRYVEAAMRRPVAVRGTGSAVVGYHNAPRLVRAARQPWFNVRTAVERRGAYSIFLPRRVFKNYLVIHNAAGVVANEDFIELGPLAGLASAPPLLAYLNSSVGEFFVRSQGFQYGGGVFNLNPGRVGLIPVLNSAALSAAAGERLAGAWDAFVGRFDHPTARAVLDAAVAESLDISEDLLVRVSRALDEMVGTALSATSNH